MSDERRLDDALRDAAQAIGPLDGFEARVGDSLRAREAADVPGLERRVRETIERVERPRAAPRRRVWGAVAAAAAAVLVVVLLLGEIGGQGELLASVDRGEIRRRGATEWVDVTGSFRLRAGDEVRAGAHTAVLRFGSVEACLFPSGHVRVDAVEAPRLALVDGAIDCAAGQGRGVTVDAADSWIELEGTRAQVRRRPNGGAVYAVLTGEASVRSGDRHERLRAGRAVWIRPDRAPWPTFTVDDAPVRTLVTRIRDRWRHYRDREARRRRQDGRAPRADARWWGEPGRGDRVLVAWPSPPGAPVRARAHRILALHSADDQRFVHRSLDEALATGVPEIAAWSVRALVAIGVAPDRIAARVDRASSGSERVEAARLAALGVLGTRPAAERFRAAATAESASLAARALALAGLAGLDDPADAATATTSARLGAPALYSVDWRTSTDFCEILGYVLASTDRGPDAARALLLDTAVSVESRRRYLGAIVRAAPGDCTSLLLEVFSRGEEALRRAALLALVDPSTSAPDEGLAAFFELLVNAESVHAELALVGWWRHAAASDRDRVVDRVVELATEAADPTLRAAAVRVPLALADESEARPFVPMLRSALTDGAETVRRWAAIALARAGDRSAIQPVLAAFLRETDASVAAALARALGRLPGADTNPKVGAALAAALASMPSERLAIIAALGDLGTDFARLILEDLRATVARPDERFAVEAALMAIRSRP